MAVFHSLHCHKVRSSTFIKYKILSHPPPVTLAIDYTRAIERDILGVRDTPEIKVILICNIPSLIVLRGKYCAIDHNSDIIQV